MLKGLKCKVCHENLWPWDNSFYCGNRDCPNYDMKLPFNYCTDPDSYPKYNKPLQGKERADARLAKEESTGNPASPD